MANDTEFYLTFGGTPVGDSIHSIAVPNIQSSNQPKIIQGFRRKDPCLDGRFPAVVYTHSITVVTIGSSIGGFVGDFYGFTWLFDLDSAGATEADTLLVENADDPVIDFGTCLFTGYSLVEPDELLVHPAGLIQLNFMGTTKPTLL